MKTNTYNVNLDSFSHGQISSKLWLCEELEPHITQNSRILILGSWVNVLGFMMLTRQPKKYSYIQGIDIDEQSVEIANKICEYWLLEKKQCSTTINNANDYDMNNYDVVINCSSEHMEENIWFENIPKNTLVCIQSSNVVDDSYPWLIKNPSTSFGNFLEKYPLSVDISSGVLPIRYDNWGYDRYMTIGIK